MKRNKHIIVGTTMTLLAGIVFSFASTTANSTVAQPVKRAAVTTTDLATADAEVKPLAVTNATRTDTEMAYRVVIEFIDVISHPDRDTPAEISSNNYILGYYSEFNGTAAQPLKVSYQVQANGATVDREVSVVSNSSNNPYMPFGTSLGVVSQTLNLYLPIAPTETMIDSSIKVFNIFKTVQNSTSMAYEPDYSVNYSLSFTDVPTITKLSELMTIEFKEFATFNGDTSVIFNIEVDALDKYIADRPEAYNSNIKNIVNGAVPPTGKKTMFIRYQLSTLTNSYFEFTYANGDMVRFDIRGTSTKSLQTGHNEVNFLVGDLDYKDIVKVQYKCFSFYMDIASIDAHKTRPTSSISYLFGDVTYDTSKAKTVNVNTHIIIETLVFFVVFIGAVVGLYFYRKNKYKNDEFNRINTKQYIKSAITALLAIGGLYFLTLFIIYRATYLNNSLVVTNPCDVPITIFLVLSIIMVGYYARYFVILYRNHKTKKNNAKLKLNDVNSKDDDGTN